MNYYMSFIKWSLFSHTHTHTPVRWGTPARLRHPQLHESSWQFPRWPLRNLELDYKQINKQNLKEKKKVSIESNSDAEIRNRPWWHLEDIRRVSNMFRWSKQSKIIMSRQLQLQHSAGCKSFHTLWNVSLEFLRC